MPSRHILIPVHDFSAGGTELIAMRLAGQWLALGHRVTFLAGSADGPLQARLPRGVESVVLSPPRPRSRVSRVGLGRQMAPVARQLRPDAIFIPGNFHFVVAAALRAALPQAPVVAKISNPLLRGKREGLPGLLRKALLGVACRGIDCFVAMAEALAGDARRLLGEERVAVILDPFLDQNCRIAARSGRPGDGNGPLRLLSVGRLEPQKDPLLALEVVRELALRGVDAHLTMAGSGKLDEPVRARLRDLGLERQVELCGQVTDPGALYRQASLLLMTSHFEGVPAVAGEALSNGLPFVATPCSPWIEALAGGFPELGTATARRSAAELADAIVHRAAQPFPDTSAIERAIGQHRLDAAAAAYLALFERIAGSASGQG